MVTNDCDLGNPLLSREISVLVSLVIDGTIPRLEQLGLARECCDKQLFGGL